MTKQELGAHQEMLLAHRDMENHPHWQNAQDQCNLVQRACAACQTHMPNPRQRQNRRKTDGPLLEQLEPGHPQLAGSNMWTTTRALEVVCPQSCLHEPLVGSP